ncbi:MAG: efflux RND transporter permease subunit, partial [Halospina sp.]
FPAEAEDPDVQLISGRREVLSVGIYGDVDEWTLRKLAERARDLFEQHEGITQVELDNPPDYLLKLEISEEKLRAYNLSLEEISQRVRSSSRDIPGGSVETRRGDLLLRVKERRDLAREFAQIPIITTAGGSVLRLGEIASVADGFEETNFYSRFNGKPALGLNVFRIGSQTPLTVEAGVNDRGGAAPPYRVGGRRRHQCAPDRGRDPETGAPGRRCCGAGIHREAG